MRDRAVARTFVQLFVFPTLPDESTRAATTTSDVAGSHLPGDLAQSRAVVSASKAMSKQLRLGIGKLRREQNGRSRSAVPG